MNTLLTVLVAFVTLSTGCSKPSSPPPAKPVARWFTNEQGFIASDVQTNDLPSWSTQDGKEVHDPLEDAPEFTDAFRDANAQAEGAAKLCAGQLGCVHVYWKKKKEVLHDKYKIDWKSPADLNRVMIYD